MDSTSPFTLGIASGDPTPSGVVLWTRLAPDPLAGGGMPPLPILVRWRVAEDHELQHVVQQGMTVAWPSLAHSVHVEVEGLAADRWYFYQFSVGDAESPVGRTRTLPPFGAHVDRLRFAFVSCQDWQNGLYPAYRNLAREDLDLVVHLGDYIYEYASDPTAVRQHNGPEARTLQGYRNRYALYKTDPHLQAAHLACPWLVVPDDHEVENNYANFISEDNDDPGAFLLRRAAAYRAYYEHMPLRARSFPAGASMWLYRGLDFGDLASFSALDTRQYRTDQPCGDGPRLPCAAEFDPAQTMTGPEQEAWLLSRLDRSHAMERRRPADHVRVVRFSVGPERGLPDGSMGRIFRGPAANHEFPRLAPAVEPDRHHRRHSLELGPRSEGELPEPGERDGRNGIRGTLDLVRLSVRLDSPRRGRSACQPAHDLLRRPLSRLRALYSDA